MTDVELCSRQGWKKISFRIPAGCFFVFQSAARRKELPEKRTVLFIGTEYFCISFIEEKNIEKYL